eukprot:TRINITY_DN111566_c0_g1_i1.p1 TRINITY_DN111566_c0_g1~~TRINITY_DN111566_c0_g1_i1.p1  ORF type:complete len:124 (+),score=10.61 TRINITY_DN111566_c0_g1_i1:128-499(+)
MRFAGYKEHKFQGFQVVFQEKSCLKFDGFGEATGLSYCYSWLDGHYEGILMGDADKVRQRSWTRCPSDWPHKGTKIDRADEGEAFQHALSGCDDQLTICSVGIEKGLKCLCMKQSRGKRVKSS